LERAGVRIVDSPLGTGILENNGKGEVACSAQC
jgi:hypothetical protein